MIVPLLLGHYDVCACDVSSDVSRVNCDALRICDNIIVIFKTNIVPK